MFVLSMKESFYIDLKMFHRLWMNLVVIYQYFIYKVQFSYLIHHDLFIYLFNSNSFMKIICKRHLDWSMIFTLKAKMELFNNYFIFPMTRLKESYKASHCKE